MSHTPQRCSIWNNLKIEPGTTADYLHLTHFHYRSHKPAAITRIFRALYHGPGIGGTAKTTGLLAGVLVESLPPLACTLRSLALPNSFHTSNRSMNAALLNKEMRTISRVIVHPIFRSTGLGIALVQHLLHQPQTPYIEALAAMGRINPFFEKAGMTRFDRPPLPNAIRLHAALQKENLTLHSLTLAHLQQNPFLQKELHRFSPKKNSDLNSLLTETKSRPSSQPIYYIWSNPNP